MDDIQFKKSYSAFINPNYAVTPAQKGQASEKPNPAESEFGKIFQKTLEQNQQLTFSKHALQRMDSRNIPVSGQLVSQINSAVEKAKAKGIKDALILNGQTAFIVNIPSSTVVTTMSGQEMTDNIFTNIDGAVIL
ncbi:TIGR02530 family flagellar biosynthesis protein [Caproiciproducens galactitolivorans]|uniref:Flagellar operon protein n=1 Tax=Caproiciproducens galactitolivorans TaxID=642589 RepID=A0ABT4BQ65_9FIRM|nr:TIGR02530 family flagellar biosynthesis protein [Caproiciproducens galactitolivorans]MCY1713032.1 flagellar operon protein [Caproiciproducens galactitolivorans]